MPISFPSFQASRVNPMLILQNEYGQTETEFLVLSSQIPALLLGS